MMKIMLLLALCAAAYAGYSYSSGGHGGQGWGHGGGYGGGQGNGWRQYHGWASVNAHQTPYSNSYGLQENGNGYSKWVSSSADTHQSHGGWGYQG